MHPAATMSGKAIFSIKAKVMVIDIGVIWKGIISWVGCQISNGSKIIANVNLNNRQSKMEKVPRGIQGEKSRRDMANSRNLVSTIALSPNSGHVVLHVVLLTSFHCDVIIAQPLDGQFDCDVTVKKSANRCNVGPLAKGQLEHKQANRQDKNNAPPIIRSGDIKTWIILFTICQINKTLIESLVAEPSSIRTSPIKRQIRAPSDPQPRWRETRTDEDPVVVRGVVWTARLGSSPPRHQGLLDLSQGQHGAGVGIRGQAGVPEAHIQGVVSDQGWVVVVLSCKYTIINIKLASRRLYMYVSNSKILEFLISYKRFLHTCTVCK